MAYFNVVKPELKKILSLVSGEAQEAIVNMQTSQTRNLRSIGVLSSINFRRLPVPLNYKPEKQQTDVVQKLELKSVKNSGHNNVCSNNGLLCGDMLYQLQSQINGLFWSHRVLSRLFMFDDSHGHTPHPNDDHANSVIEKLTLIPMKYWGHVGMTVTSTSFPLSCDSSIDIIDEPLSRRNSFSGKSDEAIGGGVFLNEKMSEFGSFFVLLRHLVQGHEAILVNPSNIHAKGPLAQNSSPSDTLAKTAAIIVPIPHTSSLCVFVLNFRPIENAECEKESLNRAQNWIIVTQRAIDVSDVINELVRDYNVNSMNDLLSPASEACLLQPSIFDSSNQFDSQRSLHQESEIPALMELVEHKITKKMFRNIYFAALGSLFLFPATISVVVTPWASGGCPIRCPVAGEKLHVAPGIVNVVEVDTMREISHYISEYSIFQESLLPILGSRLETSQLDAGLRDGLRCPNAAEIISSFVSLCAGNKGDNDNHAIWQDNALCFWFVMNKSCDDNNWNSSLEYSLESDIKSFHYFSENIFGLCFLRPRNNKESDHEYQWQSFSLTSCIFEGCHIVGHEKPDSCTPILLNQMKKLLGSQCMIPICKGSEESMLSEMKGHIHEFSHQMLKVYFNTVAWKHVIDCGNVADTFREEMSSSTNTFIDAICLRGRRVSLPLATIFAYSQRQELPFLRFLVPPLAMFNSAQNATLLYNLLVKSFDNRVYLILPNKSRLAGKNIVDNDSYHFIICGDSKLAPYFIHIKIGAISSDPLRKGLPCTEVDSAAVSLVEMYGDTASDKSVHQAKFEIDSAKSQGQVSQRILVESVVNIVLYAANILLSQSV